MFKNIVFDYYWELRFPWISIERGKISKTFWQLEIRTGLITLIFSKL